MDRANDTIVQHRRGPFKLEGTATDMSVKAWTAAGDVGPGQHG